MYATQTRPTSINIDPDTHADPFYRYKMSQLVIEHTRNCTHLPNLADTTAALHVTPLMLLKYLGSNVGTACNLKKATLTGIHSVARLSDLVEAFILEMILCQECGLPELEYDKTGLNDEVATSSFKSIIRGDDPLL